MNAVFASVLFINFILSTMLTRILHQKLSSKHVIFSLFIFNSVFLSVGALLLYKLDAEQFHKQTDGLLDSLGIVTLLFFIPIITWLNSVMLQIKSRNTH